MAIYNGKHCVFEQVGVDDFSTSWNGYTYDDDNCYNNWSESFIRNTRLPQRLLLLSSLLQDNLSNTTIQTAKNGMSSTVVSTNDKIFIAAQKELMTNPTGTMTAENDALTTWGYYVSHTTASDRIKKDTNNVARYYWTRSPLSYNVSNVRYAYDDGYFYNKDVTISNCISLCFAF